MRTPVLVLLTSLLLLLSFNAAWAYEGKDMERGPGGDKSFQMFMMGRDGDDHGVGKALEHQREQMERNEADWKMQNLEKKMRDLEWEQEVDRLRD